MQRFSWAVIALLSISCFLPVQAATPTTPLSSTQRMEERKNKRLGIKTSASSRMSVYSVKPYCQKPSQAKWKCGPWSVCSLGNTDIFSGVAYGNTAWMQTRRCDSDETAICRGRGTGPIEQSCTPTKEQKEALEKQRKVEQGKLDQASQAASLVRLQSEVQEEYKLLTETLPRMDSILASFDGSASVILFQLSTQFNDLLSQMKIYNDKAKKGLFLISDLPEYTRISNAATDTMGRFVSIAKAANVYEKPLQTPQQPVYIVIPVETAPSGHSEHDCMVLKRKLAADGMNMWSGYGQYLKDHGC